ncbi:hypothetical protein JOD18_003915 [Gracilibacillus alcaliphilus]|nr:hypothetical protein [Gracilibacillus alcaliphilus]
MNTRIAPKQADKIRNRTKIKEVTFRGARVLIDYDTRLLGVLGKMTLKGSYQLKWWLLWNNEWRSVCIPYISMIAVTIIAFCMTLFLRHRHSIAVKIGFISWISLTVYFIMEYIVIQRNTVSYNFLEQPVSDLVVTTCGTDTYVLATYELCSPTTY